MSTDVPTFARCTWFKAPGTGSCSLSTASQAVRHTVTETVKNKQRCTVGSFTGVPLTMWWGKGRDQIEVSVLVLRPSNTKADEPKDHFQVLIPAVTTEEMEALADEHHKTLMEYIYSKRRPVISYLDIFASLGPEASFFFPGDCDYRGVRLKDLPMRPGTDIAELMTLIKYAADYLGVSTAHDFYLIMEFESQDDEDSWVAALWAECMTDEDVADFMALDGFERGDASRHRFGFDAYGQRIIHQYAIKVCDSARTASATVPSFDSMEAFPALPTPSLLSAKVVVTGPPASMKDPEDQ